MINIMRGLPGSGKSPWVKNMGRKGYVVCSTDSFFTDEKGNYQYYTKYLRILSSR